MTRHKLSVLEGMEVTLSISAIIFETVLFGSMNAPVDDLLFILFEGLDVWSMVYPIIPKDHTQLESRSALRFSICASVESISVDFSSFVNMARLDAHNFNVAVKISGSSSAQRAINAVSNGCSSALPPKVAPDSSTEVVRAESLTRDCRGTPETERRVHFVGFSQAAQKDSTEARMKCSFIL